MQNQLFSILIQNQIQFLYQFTSNPMEIESHLVNLISQLPYDQQNGVNIATVPHLTKHIQFFSSQQAIDTLRKLTQRGRTMAQKKNWKTEETYYLLYVIDKFCLLQNYKCDQLDSQEWLAISSFLPGRSDIDSPNTTISVPWSPFQRQMLLHLVQKQNSKDPNWKAISQKLYELNPDKTFRTGKQCRQHYGCFLKPNLKKGPWTQQEDYQLAKCYIEHGRKWSRLAKIIEGRNQNSIKNRFSLLFQSRKDTKMTNSDLLKMVKRKKQKLEKCLHFTSEKDQKNCLETMMNSNPNSFEQYDIVSQTPQKFLYAQNLAPRQGFILIEKHVSVAVKNIINIETISSQTSMLVRSADSRQSRQSFYDDYQKFIDL